MTSPSSLAKTIINAINTIVQITLITVAIIDIVNPFFALSFWLELDSPSLPKTIPGIEA